MSIVFDRDYAAETQFAIEHGARIETDADGYSYLNVSSFVSPDPENKGNLPHFRLASLRAIDVVDEPAANPDGMFHSNHIAKDAEEALSFALGLTENKPECEELLGVNLYRASEFVTRFLSNKGLSIVTVEKPQDIKTTNDNAAPLVQSDDAKDGASLINTTPASLTTQASPSREALTAELSKYTAQFGNENGVTWFTSGKTWEQALQLHCEQLSGRNSELSAKVDELQSRLGSIELGQKEALPVAGLSAQPKTLANLMNPKK